MKVVVAGATGAIGRPLVAALRRSGHIVYAITRGGRGTELARAVGATPIVASVLDRAALLRAADGVRADAVIHELTAYKHSPPTHYRSPGLRRTNTLRDTGSRNLVDFAKAIGASRYLTQSLILGYGLRDHGSEPVTEAAPFGRPQGDANDPFLAALNAAEEYAWQSGIDGIALRYGLFYGPGASAAFTRTLKLRVLPLPSSGTGHTGFVHIDDAAAATVAALDNGRAGQAYNIVDDEPVPWDTVLDAMATTIGARRPLRVPPLLLRLSTPLVAAQMLDMSIRVSNAKAKAELGWKPALPTYRDGLRTLIS